jgi:NAD-specific glutamate dehydrogenase
MLTVFGECNDGGCCLCTFRVLDDMRSLILHDGGARVGRTQVNTYKTSGVHVRGHVA